MGGKRSRLTEQRLVPLEAVRHVAYPYDRPRALHRVPLCGLTSNSTSRLYPSVAFMVHSRHRKPDPYLRQRAGRCRISIQAFGGFLGATSSRRPYGALGFGLSPFLGLTPQATCPCP